MYGGGCFFMEVRHEDWVLGITSVLLFPLSLYYFVQFRLYFKRRTKGCPCFSTRWMAKHKNLPPATYYLHSPAEAGPKATPTGGPERSERVSVAHKSKMPDYTILVIPVKTGIQDKRSPYVPLDLRVKPEDDGGEWVPESSPKMTILLPVVIPAFFLLSFPWKWESKMLGPAGL